MIIYSRILVHNVLQYIAILPIQCIDFEKKDWYCNIN
jgi:hypothetical protein